MKHTKLLLFAFLLITTVSVQAQFTAVPAAGLQKSTVHYIGESYGGGIVFYITPDALHGLVAETQDQSFSVTWYDAQNIISVADNHSTAGKNFTDWRLPTLWELGLLYNLRTVVGGFIGTKYWSSGEFDLTKARLLMFSDGPVSGKQYWEPKLDNYYVRSVRSF
jgi:hypothetical protein